MERLPALSDGCIDVLELSKKSVVVATFNRSPSKLFEEALSVASRARWNGTLNLPFSECYVAGFDRTPKQASYALELLRIARGWKSFRCFAWGREIHNLWDVDRTLRCYQLAAACIDPRAHCDVVRASPFKKHLPTDGVYRISLAIDGNVRSDAGPELFVFPCRIVSEGFELERSHAASWKDQVHGEAVRKSVDWCPMFVLRNFHRHED